MKIEPCPFCGSQPKGPHKDDGGDERCGYNFLVRLTCKCGATISKPSHHDKGGWCDDTGQAERAVIEAWNRRSTASDATPPPPKD